MCVLTLADVILTAGWAIWAMQHRAYATILNTFALKGANGNFIGSHACVVSTGN
jgi:hypothetical protein